MDQSGKPELIRDRRGGQADPVLMEGQVETHPTFEDRHAILAEIKRRHGSLKAFAATTILSASEISAALGSPYPKAERVIADALGLPPQRLWPDRYWKNGRRRIFPTRPQRSGASQKGENASDTESAQ